MPRWPNGKRVAVFKKLQILRLPRLLNMMYKPSEIAEELGVSIDTVKKVYIPNGAPVEKDATGHNWINGIAFKEWGYSRTRRALKDSPRRKLPADKVYCLRCRGAVDFVQTDSKPMHRAIELLTGICPVCGVKVNKIVGKKKEAK